MKSYKPTTPSRRHMQVAEYKALVYSVQPRKSLTKGMKKSAGRNNRGRITVRHRGGGAKRLQRIVDFKYDKLDVPARVVSAEYDPGRSGFIGLVLYRDGEYRYHLLPVGIKAGDEVIISEHAPIKPGNRLPLRLIPSGTSVYNVEIEPGSGAKLVRAAAGRAEILAHEEKYSQIKMPSGEIRRINKNSWASVGQVSNEERSFITIGKAGRSRHMGIRPTVRGSAMNPVDHPYGGGEGRTLRGTRRPKNLWGRGTRGVKTRKRHKYSNSLILQKRKK
ncbi:MAG: 50S ribosomal protein L2 [Candidatus Niyogibacteria bacterium]|nr:MAG: 50S ribosomal protein L2 [Candidatus Niyogibacteria bacterium]